MILHACQLNTEIKTTACFSETVKTSNTSWERYAVGDAILQIQDIMSLIVGVDSLRAFPNNAIKRYRRS